MTPEELADLDRRIDEALASAGCTDRQACGVRRPIRPGQSVGAAAYVGEDGTLSCVHVTDDPAPVLHALARGDDLAETYERQRKGRIAELGPGLYCSNAPELWMGRAHRKWDFAYRLTPEERQRVAEAVLNHAHMTWPDYLTRGEKETMHRYMEDFVKTGHVELLIMASEQPYNIPVWKPDFLRPLGIEPGPQPQSVPVEVEGPFVEVSGMVSRDAAKALREAGFTGACDPGGMMSYPQCVIWKTEAVKRFGSYRREE